LPKKVICRQAFCRRERGEAVIHPETGEKLERRTRVITVSYQGLTRNVPVTGWFPREGDGFLTGDDSAPLDAALAEMKAEKEGK